MSGERILSSQKKVRRCQVKGELGRRFTSERSQAAACAASLLLRMVAESGATRIGLYAADEEELPTENLFESLSVVPGVHAYLPKIEGTTLRFLKVSSWDVLERGEYGILAPSHGTEIDVANLDLLVVPGRSFDYFGRRLGRGGGYYDRLLQPYLRPRLVVGYAFDFQVVPSLATEAHDQKVDRIVTEKRILHT